MIQVVPLEMEKGAMNQGMWEASRSWERQGNIFSPGATRRERSCTDSLILSWPG